MLRRIKVVSARLATLVPGWGARAEATLGSRLSVPWKLRVHRASHLHGPFMLLPPQEGPPGMWKDLRNPPIPLKVTTESPRLAPAPLIYLDQPCLPPGGHCLSTIPTLLSWDHSASETLSQDLTLQMAARSLEGGVRMPAGSRDSAHWARTPAMPPGHG